MYWIQFYFWRRGERSCRKSWPVTGTHTREMLLSLFVLWERKCCGFVFTNIVMIFNTTFCSYYKCTFCHLCFLLIICSIENNFIEITFFFLLLYFFITWMKSKWFLLQNLALGFSNMTFSFPQAFLQSVPHSAIL